MALYKFHIIIIILYYYIFLCLTTYYVSEFLLATVRSCVALSSSFDFHFNCIKRHQMEHVHLSTVPVEHWAYWRPQLLVAEWSVCQDSQKPTYWNFFAFALKSLTEYFHDWKADCWHPGSYHLYGAVLWWRELVWRHLPSKHSNCNKKTDNFETET